MSIKDMGERGAWEVLSRRKRVAAILISLAGIIFGIFFFLIYNG
jgi:hypothetical protein